MTTEHSSRIRGWPLHPLAFAVYNVLFLWGINAPLVGWREGLFLCVIAIIVAVAIQLVCAAIMRDRLAGAIVASLIVMIIFTYGRMYEAVTRMTVGDVLVGRHRFLLLACAVLVVGVASAVRPTRRSPVTATR